MAGMPDASIDILIADDHPIFRTGLREILEEEVRFRIVAECSDGESALERIRELRPHVAVLDLEMPKLSGLDVAAGVHADGLPVALIMLTICDRVDILTRAMELGVLGYILKDSAPLDLIRGIDAVLRGEYFVSPSLSGRALRQHQESDESTESRIGLSQLTQTERRILRMIAENKSSHDIGEILHISPRTVDTHRSNINHKLGLKGSHRLVRFALQHRDSL